MLAFVSAMAFGLLGAQSSDGRLTIAPNTYTYEEVAKLLSGPGRIVYCEPDLKGRACVLRLTARTWANVKEIFSSGLGLELRPLPRNSESYKLIEPESTRRRHSQMRRKILSFFEHYAKSRCADEVALVKDANGDASVLRKQSEEVLRRMNKEKDDAERTRLGRRLEELSDAVGYAEYGYTRLAIDQLLSADPQGPEDLTPPDFYWAQVDIATLPQLDVRGCDQHSGGAPSTYSVCLFRWALLRGMYIGFEPEWSLAGRGNRRNDQSLMEPALFAGEPGKVLDQINSGESDSGWPGLGKLAENTDRDLDAQSAAALASVASSTQLKSDQIDCMPELLLAWSKKTGTDVAEELNPFADSFQNQPPPFDTVAQASIKCPQVGFKSVLGCLVAFDKLQFMDEACSLPLSTVVRCHRILEHDGASAIPGEEVYRAYFSAPQEDAASWFLTRGAPSKYLNVPTLTIETGALAYLCWAQLSQDLSKRPGQYPLSSFASNALDAILEQWRPFDVFGFQSYLDNARAILASQQLVVTAQDTVGGITVRASLAPSQPGGPELYSSFTTIVGK